MRRIHSLGIPASLSFPPPYLLPAPLFHPAPSSCFHPSLIFSLPLHRPHDPRWIVLYVWVIFFFTPFYHPSPRVPGAGLEGSCFSREGGPLRLRSTPCRAGCFIEPRSESGGVTQGGGGCSAPEWKVLSRSKSPGTARGGGLGGLWRWRRTLLAPCGGRTEPPISGARRPPSQARLCPLTRVEGPGSPPSCRHYLGGLVA